MGRGTWEGDQEIGREGKEGRRKEKQVTGWERALRPLGSAPHQTNLELLSGGRREKDPGPPALGHCPEGPCCWFRPFSLPFLQKPRPVSPPLRCLSTGSVAGVEIRTRPPRPRLRALF